MDNFKGQVTPAINELLEANNIHVCLLPPNTTDLLQPMDVAVNKPAKDFLKHKFEHWYSDEVMSQLQCVSDVESAEIQPVNLCMAVVKELSTCWLVEMAEYIADNPQFIINDFQHPGISSALDGTKNLVHEHNADEESDMLSDDEYESVEDILVLSD